MKHLSVKIWMVSVSLAFISVLVVANLLYKRANRLTETAYWISQSSQVQYASEKIFSSAARAEAGINRYVSGNADQGLMERMKNDIALQVPELKKRITANPYQAPLINRLEKEVNRLLQFIDSIAFISQRAGTPIADRVLNTINNDRSGDRIRATIREIQLNDNSFLQERKQTNEKAIDRIQFALVIWILLAIVLCVLSGIAGARLYGARKKQNARNAYQSELLENVQDAILSTDKDFQIRSWNKGAEKIYGWKPEQVMGMSMDGLLSTTYPSHTVLPGPLACCREKGWFKGEALQVTKAGKNISVAISATALHDATGKFSGIVVVNRDSSEQKLVEQKLIGINAGLKETIRLKIAELGNVFERITDAFVALDNNWCYVYVNRKAGEMLTSAPRDLLGKNIWDIFQQDKNGPFYESCQQAFREQQYAHLEAYYEPQGRWIENHIYPSPQGVSIFFRDITARKQSEEAIQLVNEKFNIIARITNDSIWDWNLLTNQVQRHHTCLETYFGYEPFAPGEVDARWKQLVHPEDWKRITEKRKAIFENNKENYWEDEYRFKRSDGEWGYVFDKGFILRNESGEAIRMVGASRDISERKNAETSLKEKNSELKDLSAYLQHMREEERKLIAFEVHEELGQLASVLKIDVDWLNLKIAPTDETIQKRIAHANRIVEQLIVAIRKMAAGLRPSILDHFGLNAALQWHCDEFEKLHGVTCSFKSDIDDQVLPVEVKTSIYRIVQESLTNVAKHAQAHLAGVVLTEDSQKLYLTITDDGIGFDASGKKGTLGLVGLRERAISMNGELTIESAKGAGTKLAVMIPKQELSNG